jgi:phenylpyruvate tautomerase PptA (4-oxalocrotonate tautomerase family)
MPFLTVYTNANIENEEALAEEASVLVADVLHKPINYVVANIVKNNIMCFGGNIKQKGALVEVLSIGFADKDLLVEKLTDFLSSKLNIEDKNNINISLVDAPASKVASGGRTFG